MRKLKKLLVYLTVMALFVSTGLTALAAPAVGEDYTFEDLADYVDYFFEEVIKRQDVWGMGDGESLDPKDVPEGQAFVSQSYIDALEEKARELWAVGDGGEESVEAFNASENKDARQALYQELKSRAEALESNIRTGTRPSFLDSLYKKSETAWALVDKLSGSYGDAEDPDSQAKNVHVIWPEEDETVDDEFINNMNSMIPAGHYWILGEDWMYFWQSTEAMDWVYDTLTEGDKKLTEAEDTGSWDALDGLGALLDRACERTREMRSFLETHLYPRPEPENPQITVQEETHGEKSGKTQEEAAPEKKANQVKGSDGKILISTLDGVYAAHRVDGIAVVTEKVQAEAAAGLQGTGSRLSLYTSDVSEKNELLQVMEEAAGMLGAKTAGAVLVDLYAIEGGRVSAVRNMQAPMRMVIELPQSMVEAGRTFSILVPDGRGGVLELVDLDQDPSTITVDTMLFGMWTIIYR
ncbi:MAG: hypothetical protein ACLVAW_05615 [Eisenbergiella massiliensis]